MISKSLLLTAVLAAVSEAQSVSGTVFDSLARAPLAGAVVQIVPADNQARATQTTTADSLGRFTFNAVAGGRYTIGFFHPMLDSIGLQPPLREVVVSARPLTFTLAIPSPARMREAVCRDSLGAGGAIQGFVRDARTLAMVSGVNVEARWMELTIKSLATSSNVSSRIATTNSAGWFRLCNVPRPGTLSLVASRGDDSTDVLQVEMTSGGFARGDLYLGSGRVVVERDTSPGADTTPPRFIRVGDGRLTGVVRTYPQQHALEGAHVRIVGGIETTTNERGEWTLTGIPSGTRTLEVRKIGYFPEQRTVNVVSDAAPVLVALSTMRAMLDTVRVRATRLANPEYARFEERRRSSGFGTFLGVAELSRRGGIFTSDLFRMVPGVYVTRRLGEPKIEMRSSFFGGRCEPTIYMDGHKFAGLRAADLDGFVDRDNVIGIEIYREAVPAQFQEALSGCGSIVIWTDQSGALARQQHTRYAGSFKHGLIFLAAAGLLVLLTR